METILDKKTALMAFFEYNAGHPSSRQLLYQDSLHVSHGIPLARNGTRDYGGFKSVGCIKEIPFKENYTIYAVF